MPIRADQAVRSQFRDCRSRRPQAESKLHNTLRRSCRRPRRTAQFYQIGDFLYPNNLPANAHGNGYADPNFLIAPTIEGVKVDGAAFNVREGNNSIDVAASYVPRQQVTSFVQVTGDYRDGDVMAGWGPSHTNAWIAAEVSFGNGFLARLEHRQQYKLNGFRQFNLGRHQLTLFGVGYYGFSFVPGLIPIHVLVSGDTIDNRQLDRTHTFLGGCERHLEAKRTETAIVLGILPQLRSHAAVGFRRRFDSAE